MLEEFDSGFWVDGVVRVDDAVDGQDAVGYSRVIRFASPRT